MVQVPGWIHRAAGGWPGRARGPIGYRPGPGTRHPGHPSFHKLHRAEWASPVAQGTITAQGGATLVLAPHGGVTWYPHEATVFCSANPAYQVFVQIYRGGPNGLPVALLGSSFTGSGDTIDIGTKPIRPGDALIAVFSMGRPGDSVTVAYEGQQDVLS